LRREAWQWHGVHLSVLERAHGVISNALTWTAVPLDEALASLPQLIAQRLEELEVSREGMEEWAALFANGKAVGPFHWKNRRLCVPELKRLQGFPDAFEFSGSRRSIQVQLGNSVPPLLACVVADSLQGQLADKPRGQLQLFSAAQIVG